MATKLGGVEYLTAEEVAALVNCSPITVRVACRQYVQTGGRLGLKGQKLHPGERSAWAIPRGEVDRWQRRRRGPGNPTFRDRPKAHRSRAGRKPVAVAS